MTSSDTVEAVFDEVDTNQDGKIDKKEMRNWISRSEGLTSSPYESSSYGHNQKDNTTSRYNYRETTAATSSSINDSVINTNSPEETKRYLERSGINIYIDPNPQIVRRATTERPLTFEQRVLIRCLQPPALPPPEPLTIKEVRPEQPPPPPPLVIREQTPRTTSLPPIIFREQPPTPPARIPGETVVRYLPPVPVPPRSVIIERFASAPEKPRDIIIERWLPYGPQPERRKIVQPAPPAVKYPAPTHTVIVYDALQSNTVRKFERLGVTQEDPDAYVAQYGASLLDPATIVRQARDAGVTEDISCPILLSSTTTTTRAKVVDFDESSDVINQGVSSSTGFSYERMQRIAGTEAAKFGSSSCSSSTSHCIGDSALASNVRETRSGYHVSGTGYSAINRQRDSELNQTESHRYL